MNVLRQSGFTPETSPELAKIMTFLQQVQSGTWRNCHSLAI